MVVPYSFSKSGVVKKSIPLKPSLESVSTHRNPLAIPIVAMKRKHNVLPQDMENAHWKKVHQLLQTTRNDWNDKYLETDGISRRNYIR